MHNKISYSFSYHKKNINYILYKKVGNGTSNLSPKHHFYFKHIVYEGQSRIIEEISSFYSKTVYQWSIKKAEKIY